MSSFTDPDPVEFTDVEIVREIRDEGTIVLFHARTIPDGGEYIVGVDHRPAADIRAALEAGDRVEAVVPDYAFMRHYIVTEHDE